MRIASRELYLALGPGVSLHLLPDGAWVYATTRPPEGYTRTRVDRLGATLLARADGSTPLPRLLAEAGIADADRALSFIIDAMERGHAVLWPHPSPQPVRVTGTHELVVPTHAALELTGRCAARCLFCYRGDTPVEVELSGPAWVELLGRLHDDGVRVVELTGGEPTLHPAFVEILDEALSRFDLVGVLTSGTGPGRAIDALHRSAPRLVVGISIHGPSPAVHDRVTGCPGSWERATALLERLSSAGALCRAAMTVCPENVDHVEETLERCMGLGARAFGVSTYLPLGRGRDLRVDAEVGRRITGAINRTVERHPDCISVLPESMARGRNLPGGCGAGHRSMAIGPAGEVRPCVLCPVGELTLGELGALSLRQIAATPLARALSRSRPPCPEICGDCPDLPFCTYCLVRGRLRGEQRGSSCRWLSSPDGAATAVLGRSLDGRAELDDTP